jgi:hypothetical protein
LFQVVGRPGWWRHAARQTGPDERHFFPRAFLGAGFFGAGFSGGASASASLASRTARNRSVLAMRAALVWSIISRAILVVVSILVSAREFVGLKTPISYLRSIQVSFNRQEKRPGTPDLLPSASMASASTSVVKGQKRNFVARHALDLKPEAEPVCLTPRSIKPKPRVEQISGWHDDTFSHVFSLGCSLCAPIPGSRFSKLENRPGQGFEGK